MVRLSRGLSNVPSSISEERLEEFAPGLDPELPALVQAAADLELAEVDAMIGPVGGRITD